MKIFAIAVCAALGIAVFGGLVLSAVQEGADKAYSTTGVRLGA